MSKFDKVLERLHSIDTTLAAQHVTLAEHIRRTSILEEEIKPLKNHVNMMSGAVKFITLGGGALAIIIEIIRLVIK